MKKLLTRYKKSALLFLLTLVLTASYIPVHATEVTSTPAETASTATATTAATSTTNSKKAAKLINILQGYSNRVKSDTRKGKRWYYGCTRVSKTFAQAARRNRRTSCAYVINWALRDMKILKTSETMSSNSSGRFRLKGKYITNTSKTPINKHFNVIDVGNKTALQLLNEGKLKKGDICCYYRITHMNVYAGKNSKGKLLWYDAGRIYNGAGKFTNKKKSTFVFSSFGPVALDNSPSIPKQPQSALKIRYILRFK